MSDLIPLDEAKRKERGTVKRRFPLVRFKDIKLSATAAYLVKGVIPSEGLVVVWGPPKCGKSFWVYDLMMHVAKLGEYRGRRVKQGTVVYIACEGEKGLSARTEAFREAKLTESDEGDAPFYLLTTKLDLAADAGVLIADIKAQIPDTAAAIVIDTLNRSLSGSESRDEDMGAYVKAADAIRDAFKCAVVVIHHCGLDDTRARGHTSLLGAVDAEISVKRDVADTIVATVELMKDGEAGAEIFSRLEVVPLGQDEDGEEMSSCVIVEAEAPVAGGKKSGEKRLPDQAQNALVALKKAIGEEGLRPPASFHIPPHARAVARSQWRRYCDLAPITASTEKQAQTKAFERAADKLKAREIIASHAEWVWIVD